MAGQYLDEYAGFTMGGRIKYQLTPEVTTQVGVYEFNPDNGNGKAEGQGWSLDTEHADGVTIPVEVIWTPKALLNGLAGSYRVGGIYNTADDPNNQYDVAYGKGVVGEDGHLQDGLPSNSN